MKRERQRKGEMAEKDDEKELKERGKAPTAQAV